MKVPIRFVLLVGVLLTSFFYTPVYAQESNCDEMLLADLSAHEVAMYLFSEIERPAYDVDGNPIFARQDFVVAIIVYSNKLTIESDTCGIGTQARLLSWAFEVYRVKGNMRFKLIDEEAYKQQQAALFALRLDLYGMYCEAYPIACRNGVPMSYQELVEKIDPPVANGGV